MSPRFEWSCRTVELGSRSFWELAGVEGWVFSAYMEPVHLSIRLGSILLSAANSGELPWCSFVIKIASCSGFQFYAECSPPCLFAVCTFDPSESRTSHFNCVSAPPACLLQRRICQSRQAFADQPLRFYLAYMNSPSFVELVDSNDSALSQKFRTIKLQSENFIYVLVCIHKYFVPVSSNVYLYHFNHSVVLSIEYYSVFSTVPPVEPCSRFRPLYSWLVPAPTFSQSTNRLRLWRVNINATNLPSIQRCQRELKGWNSLPDWLWQYYDGR